MATISKLKGSNGTSYDIMDRVSRDESVYFIEPTGTAGSTTSGAQLSAKWTIANVGGLTTPYHGMKVAVKVPVAGVSTAGAIMSIDGGTTWHPIAYNVNTVFTTHYAVNTVKIFIYDANQSMTGYIDAGTSTSISGVWKGESNYDSGNTNTIGYQLRTNSSVWKAHSALYRYELLCSVSETQLSPFNNVSNKSTTNTKALLTNLEFNPFGKFVYYGATTTVSAGSNISATALWQQYNLTLGYSFNTAGLMTTNKDVFLRCVPQSNGMVKIDPATQDFTNNTGPISQLLPTTEDGFVYIYLGHATSDSAIELHYEHPVYFYKDNSLRIWTNAAASGGSEFYDISLEVQENSSLSDNVFEIDTTGLDKQELWDAAASGKTVRITLTPESGADPENLPINFPELSESYSNLIATVYDYGTKTYDYGGGDIRTIQFLELLFDCNWEGVGIDTFNPDTINISIPPKILLVFDGFVDGDNVDWNDNNFAINMSNGGGGNVESYPQTIDGRIQYRTLLKPEFDYILNTRTGGTVGATNNARYVKAKIGDINGLIIFPDNISWAGAEIVNINDPTASFSGNSLPQEYWDMFEQRGCVFLPCAGTTSHGEYMRDNSFGYYRTASIHDSNSYNGWTLTFSDSDLIFSQQSVQGASVRLVYNEQYGKFTINSNGDKVNFTRGNLQHNNAMGMWRFAPNQWEFCGYDNDNYYEGGLDPSWHDMFPKYNTQWDGYSSGTGEDLVGQYAPADWGVWISKKYFSGSYNDLTDKPSIPTIGSGATNAAAGNHKHTITIATGSTGDVTVATGSSGTGDAAAQTHTHTASATGTTAVSAYTSNTPTYKKLTTTSQTNGTAASWSYTETLVTGTTDDYMLEFSWTANTPSSVATTVATGALESGAAGDLISSISFGGTNVAAQSHTHSVPATSTTKVTAVTGVNTTKLSATASTPTA